MDFVSVSEAAYRLLQDTFDRLHRIKPDIMVEFRQEYIGPVMRRFGNMFRAGDCPNDALTNRVRTLDIRLLCGDTACHSDMLMWHPHDRVESAALQVLATLFCVPQVSVLLDRLAPAHLKMLRFWLDFWRANRDVLLDGELRPLHPEALYPVVVASTSCKRLIAVYQEMVAPAGSNVPPELLVVNATLGSRVVIDMPEAIGARTVEICDCQGNVVARERRELAAGLHVVPIPPAGLARIHT
jgi:alpha-galactosidase